MSNNSGRAVRAKNNILSSLFLQVISVICGLIVPRLMISAYGSEAYGMTSSITQFLAYISLLEGGIGGVARAALYKPLAENDTEKISSIYAEISSFFRKIGYAFAVYVIILACTFKFISSSDYLDWFSTFLLVLAISVSTFGQYFIGIANTILLRASQRMYVTNLISVVATIVNTLLTVILIRLGCNIIVVKFVSSCIYFLRPVAMWLYVKRNFNLVKCDGKNSHELNQKGTALGQHLAYFIHSNTDVVVLTIFSDLKLVAVYSVYNMVVSQIQNLTTSFASGMEAVFGDMIAKNEIKKANETFGYYDTLISLISTILYSATFVLIIPFVNVYTTGISDVNYIRPVFAVILISAGMLYCLRMPYHYMIVAAGHFKQTKVAAYGEAIINVAISILLVRSIGLVGVAIGTVVGTLFRFIFYAAYLSKNIIVRPISHFIRRMVVNIVDCVFICGIGLFLLNYLSTSNWFEWIRSGIIISLISVVTTLLMNGIFFREDTTVIFGKYLKRFIGK